jgi:hypothetical protein
LLSSIIDEDDDAIEDVDDVEAGCGISDKGIGIEESELFLEVNSVNSLD